MRALVALSVMITALVVSPPEAQAFSRPELVFTVNGVRVDAEQLDGASIAAGSDVGIFIAPRFHPARRVDFYLNGVKVRTENAAPWDLSGTGPIGNVQALWSSDLPEGRNVVEARIRGWFNRNSTLTATFYREPVNTTTLPGLGLNFAKSEAVLDGYVQRENLSGAGLVVVHPDHGIVHESYRGEIDADRVSLIASSNKMISAGVLLHLADEGLLDMNEPISNVVDWAGDLADVTPAQLLSNSSGLGGLPLGYLAGALCTADKHDTLLDCAKAVASNTLDDALQVAPDTEYRYGGPQWQVAGGVAESVSGKSWATLIDEIYVQPCGLDVLGFTNLGQAGLLQQLVSYPLPFGDGGFDVNALAPTQNPVIEGGGYTTPVDYANILLMLMRDGRCGDTQVLSPEAIDMMFTDRIGPAYSGTTPLGTGYGLGWTVDEATEVRIDPGAFGAVPWIDLDDGYAAYFVIEHVSLPGSSGRIELRNAVQDTIRASALGDDPIAAETLFQSADDADVVGAFVSDGVGFGVPNGAAVTSSVNSVTFTFNVARAGSYKLVGTVLSPTGRDDSFYVQVNNQAGRGERWSTGKSSSYNETTVSPWGSSQPTVFSLPAGVNEVAMNLREDGTYISSLELVRV